MEPTEGVPAAATPAAPVWPCVPRRGPAGPPAAGRGSSAGSGSGSGSRYVMPASDVREDGTGSAPNYSESWSAGLSSALEKADQDRAAAGAAAGQCGRAAVRRCGVRATSRR